MRTVTYQPKVSIIIPLYNGSNYVKQAIDCALAQTYKNIEIIVVNDGSKDDGAGEKIAMSYGDKIRYFHKENGGVSSALNYGIKEMTGEWFSWLSHDDLYEPEKIEKQIKYINGIISREKDVDLNKVIVHCKSDLIDVNGKEVYKTSRKSKEGYIPNIEVILANLKHNDLGGCSFLLPKSCVADVGGFDEKIRTISDFDYWYRLLFAGYRFYQMPDWLVHYRVHRQQVTYTNTVGEREINEFYIYVADSIIKNPGYKSYSNLIFVLDCCTERKYKSATEHIKELICKEYGSVKIKDKIKLFLYNIKYYIKNILRRIFMAIKIK